MPALDRRPVLPETLAWIWTAYSELTRSRNWSMGSPQPIALSEILAYSELINGSQEETFELISFVRELDDVFFERQKGITKSGDTSSRHRRARRGKRR